MVRKSSRLSGALPDLSLAEASKVLDSPRRSRTSSATSNRANSEERDEVIASSKRPTPLEIIPEDNKDSHPKVVASPVKATVQTPLKSPVKATHPAVVAASSPVKAIPVPPSPAKATAAVAAATPGARPAKPTLAAVPPAKVRGTCKSGRFWKSERDRFRSVLGVKGLKMDFKQRQQQKEDQKRVRQFESFLKEERRAKIEDLKRRKEENKKRREENERKNEIVQVIKNPAKLKRMKKKQLRKLAKRDTTVVQKTTT